jgi:hypothetical protein
MIGSHLSSLLSCQPEALIYRCGSQWIAMLRQSALK